MRRRGAPVRRARRRPRPRERRGAQVVLRSGDLLERARVVDVEHCRSAAWWLGLGLGDLLLARCRRIEEGAGTWEPGLGHWDVG